MIFGRKSHNDMSDTSISASEVFRQPENCTELDHFIGAIGGSDVTASDVTTVM